MTIQNPKQVNKAVFYVDERNQLCHECCKRLFDADKEGDIMIPPSIAPCTECVAFAAGVHPSLPKNEPYRAFDNADRAERGAKALEFYMGLTTDWKDEEPHGNLSALGDLIADLMHLAASWPDEDGMSPNVERVINMAEAHFTEETEEAEAETESNDLFFCSKCGEPFSEPVMICRMCRAVMEAEAKSDETQ